MKALRDLAHARPLNPALSYLYGNVVHGYKTPACLNILTAILPQHFRIFYDTSMLSS